MTLALPPMGLLACVGLPSLAWPCGRTFTTDDRILTEGAEMTGDHLTLPSLPAQRDFNRVGACHTVSGIQGSRGPRETWRALGCYGGRG